MVSVDDSVSYKQIVMTTTVLVTSLCFATKMHEGITLGQTRSEELGERCDCHLEAQPAALYTSGLLEPNRYKHTDRTIVLKIDNRGFKQ